MKEKEAQQFLYHEQAQSVKEKRDDPGKQEIAKSRSDRKRTGTAFSAKGGHSSGAGRILQHKHQKGAG